MIGNRAIERAIAESCKEAFLSCTLRALLLLSIILFSTGLSFAQSGNNMRQYDINDPRNPDCPCHKYQKLADDEYRQTKYNDQVNQFTLNMDINPLRNKEKEQQFQMNTIEFDSAPLNLTKGSGTSYKKSKKKHHGKGIRKKINRAKLKHSGIKKLRPDYSVCYKW